MTGKLLALLAISASVFCTEILATGEAVRSEPYDWKNVTVVAGGFIPGIVFSPVEKDLVYLRSDMGGCYRWDAKEKTWMPMHDQFAESSYFGGESIAPDPVDPNVVYIAAGMYRSDPSAMLRSRDKGKTWEVFPVSFRMGGNEDGRGVGERLAVDPNQTSTLYFGSRYDGLQRSTDSGATWQKVESFPLKGKGVTPQGKPPLGGLSFVTFEPRSGSKGSPTKAIFVGNVDPGDEHLFRSDDAGQTWKPVDGGPGKAMLPAKGQIDETGVLYLTYGNGIGPNGVTDGAVWKLDTKSNKWTDITPDKRPDRPKGGYMGLSLDRQKPGTLGVTTMNRWGPIDTVWRSTDGGETWKDIVGKSERDVSLSPYLYWGNKEPRLGWWMAAFAIDPFDSDHAAYATGATVFATKDFSNVSKDETTHWFVWGKGIEQTAIITLCSPTEGADLFSGFGDIGGFAHFGLDKSPPTGMYDHPLFGNTEVIDYAGKEPNVVVRSGRPHEGQAPLAYSEDGGKTWQPIQVPEHPAATTGNEPGRRRRESTPAITVSADGKTFVIMTSPPMLTRDRGKTWEAVKDLPANGRPVMDRVDPARAYSMDFEKGKVYASNDGGATFSAVETSGLPADIKSDRPTWSEAAWPLHATLNTSGDLWFVSHDGLYHSADGGKSFEKAPGDVHVDALSFGKAPLGSDYPALFAIGTRGKLKAIWRSDDMGKSWLRINDDENQYGTRFRCISGDPKVFGRVYIGTDGRGVLYADPK